MDCPDLVKIFEDKRAKDKEDRKQKEREKEKEKEKEKEREKEVSIDLLLPLFASISQFSNEVRLTQVINGLL